MHKNVRLTLYCDEADITHGKATFELIVQRAQEIKCKHVVVTAGILGSRKGSGTGYLAAELPVVVEIIADEEHMNMLLPFVKDVFKAGTATLETVSLL